MTATATEKIGIMESRDGVHTAAAMAVEKIEFFSPFRCRCHRNVNEPFGSIHADTYIEILEN